MDSSHICSIILKFGGYWSEVQGQARMKYVGGSQKSLKLRRDEITMLLLKEHVETLCHWLRGQPFDLHYHVNGTSPKNYLLISSDSDVVEMLECSYERNKIEVVVEMLECSDELLPSTSNAQPR
ncbi:hypothetical protein MA16_Dca002642 [Dendrobium catenatum]|uniref:PB1-like domain-containing protein n=1 Tax=Dendrobium catenatum TaxID=906689 RepID=A0A2I0W135_9ASPA|nr:hypothetical protein MA16_Dca002642 [Dendrobium catenatum]